MNKDNRAADKFNTPPVKPDDKDSTAQTARRPAEATEPPPFPPRIPMNMLKYFV